MHLRLIPQQALQVLEFDKVTEKIRSYCLGPVAGDLASRIVPEAHYASVTQELERAHEAQRILGTGGTLLAHTYSDLTPVLRKLSVHDYILDEEEILEIRRVLALVADVRAFFSDGHREEFSHLWAVAMDLPDPAGMLRAIGQIIDEAGHVRPDASRTLLRIARDLQSVSQQRDSVFQQLVRQYAAKEWLADTLESIRNERRVLAVKAEYKRQIRGIIHDQSASGRTALIEPEEVIGINNDLFDLRAESRAEVRRLLMALCDTLRADIDEIRTCMHTITALDLYQAKGQLGRALDAHMPVIQPEPCLRMRRSFHPLLLLRNKGRAVKTIPFDLELHGNNRLLLLSGPNAGGKSILMKAVGLLQVMVQSGIPVPVSPDAVFGIFNQISVSLGDHQSLENDLSTYSSKLAEMRECLVHAGEDSLVLIDEFGSGTDPRLGGAIAEGILEGLRTKQVYGVITTHYSELKVYAYRKRGIVNGAMVFDKESMLPTYELRVGKPGSSYTFEIAARTGLPEDVLSYATQRTEGLQLKAMEDLLADLETQKSKLEAAQKQLDQRSTQLDQLVQSYERIQNDLTAQRHRIRLEQKEQEYARLSQMNRDLEKTIRSIREEKNMDAAREKIQEVKQTREEARKEIGALHKTLREKTTADHKPLKADDFVRVRNGTQTGRIERISKNKATVVMGNMRLQVPVADLLPAGEPLDIRETPSVQMDTGKEDQFDPRLDLRGMRPIEALALLEKFMDLALVSHASSVEIIHGKGTGALRRLVTDKLREYPVREIEQPKDAHGGSGFTIVRF